LGLGALATFGVSVFNSQSAVPMAGIMESTAIIGLLILLIGALRIKNKVDVSGGGAVVAH